MLTGLEYLFKSVSITTALFLKEDGMKILFESLASWFSPLYVSADYVIPDNKTSAEMERFLSMLS
jgi:hypothetical protein